MSFIKLNLDHLSIVFWNLRLFRIAIIAEFKIWLPQQDLQGLIQFCFTDIDKLKFCFTDIDKLNDLKTVIS